MKILHRFYIKFGFDFDMRHSWIMNFIIYYNFCVSFEVNYFRCIQCFGLILTLFNSSESKNKTRHLKSGWMTISIFFFIYFKYPISIINLDLHIKFLSLQIKMFCVWPNWIHEVKMRTSEKSLQIVWFLVLQKKSLNRLSMQSYKMPTRPTII